jgi:hypothetical protein
MAGHMTRLPLLLLAAVTTLACACTTVRVTPTARSSIEQRLLVRSLEHAADRIALEPLLGQAVRVQLLALTGDQGFAEEFLRTRLQARGVRIVRGGDAADLTVQFFAAALAVDTAETFLGIPATFQVPVLAVPLPEIALFKWERSQGRVELQQYTYDRDGRLLERQPDTAGEARWNRFTILVVVSFRVTELKDAPAPEPTSSPEDK